MKFKANYQGLLTAEIHEALKHRGRGIDIGIPAFLETVALRTFNDMGLFVDCILDGTIVETHQSSSLVLPERFSFKQTPYPLPTVWYSICKTVPDILLREAQR